MTTSVKSKAVPSIVLHIFHWDPKFYPSFSSFLAKRYGLGTNPIVLEGAPPGLELEEGVTRLNETSRLSKLRHYWSSLSRATRAIIHGAFDVDLRVALAIRPDLAAKCSWVPWGGDLYWAAEEPCRPKTRIHRAIFRRAVRCFPNLLTYLPGDAELAQGILGFKGNTVPCLMYESNVVSGSVLATQLEAPIGTDRPLRVFVGNSATASSHHELAFRAIASCAPPGSKVVCALNYGDPHYRADVISMGRDMFSDDFEPLINWMSRCNFENLLNTVDVGIFAHQRQQGMGTIITLFALGKQVVLRAGSSQARYFSELGAHFTKLEAPDLQPLDHAKACHNRALISHHHSMAAYQQDWDRIIWEPL